MKVAAIAAVLAASVSLSSCVSTSNTPQQNAEIAYNNLCAVEPSVYLGYMAFAATRNVSEKTQRRVEQAHIAFTRLCTDRPTDLVAGLRTLSQAYAEVVSYKS